MLGYDTPDEAAPDGGHVHEVFTVGNRDTGEIIRWEQCRTCPQPQPTTTWTDDHGYRHILAEGTHVLIPVGAPLNYWWAEHAWDNTDHTITYAPVLFDQPRPTDQPYALNWEERDEWLTHLTGHETEPDMTEDEWLDTLQPLDPDHDEDEDEDGPDASDDDWGDEADA
ncbi:MAG: hypothetical protein ACOX61_01165 [Brooklawnia sp.]|jgi:hypothetical protein